LPILDVLRWSFLALQTTASLQGSAPGQRGLGRVMLRGASSIMGQSCVRVNRAGQDNGVGALEAMG
jgi:hypothetical protein